MDLSNTDIGRELELEKYSVMQGQAKYFEYEDRLVSQSLGSVSPSSKMLVSNWIPAIAKYIKQDIDSYEGDKTRILNKHYHIKSLMQLAPERSAVIAVFTTLSILLQDRHEVARNRLVYNIGRNLNAQVLLPDMRAEPEIMAEIGKLDKSHLRPENVMKIARQHSQFAVWSRKDMIHAGAFLAGAMSKLCLVDGEPAFIVQKRRTWDGSRMKTPFFFVLSPLCLKKLANNKELLSSLKPRFMPMVCKPADWDGVNSGGYLSINARLVKGPTLHVREKLGRMFADDRVPVAVKGLNILQSTPWKINAPILAVAQKVWESGGLMAGLPRYDEMPLPDLPPDIDSDDSIKQEWKSGAARVYRQRARESGQRVVASMKLSLAHRFVDEDAIWFPMVFDLTSRMYPKPIFLNYQSDDLSRGLLKFANSCERNYHSERWMKIHLANVCGHDKFDFQTRVDWVDNSADVISGWATKPLENTGWMLADKPFQALAAAMQLEFADRFDLPVQLDGSCNALQHYAALGKCRSEAETTNLILTDAPNDAYTDMLDEALRLIENDDDYANNEAIQKYYHEIDRKLLKTPLMTALYGVTRHGATNQVLESLVSRGHLGSDGIHAAMAISSLATASMSRKFKSASAIMEWLKKCGRAIAQAKHFVEWETPCGFSVIQPYINWGSRKYATLMGSLTYYDKEKSLPSVSKHSRGLSPNFVHGLDPSHIQLIAIDMAMSGINIGTVHDGIYCLPSDCVQVRNSWRDNFVKIHKDNQLVKLRDHFTRKYPSVKIPPLPELGDWDVEEMSPDGYSLA